MRHVVAPPRLSTVVAHRSIATGQALQAKLAVSQPGDPYEQKADGVADEVMRMPDPSLSRPSPGKIQREAKTPTDAPPGAPPKPAAITPANQPAGEPELAKSEAYWDKDRAQWVHPTVAYQEVKGSAVLYGIKPSDVHQGSVGDCYLMAALASLAETSPATIARAITDDGPQRWKVRLYARQKDGSFTAHTYVIDNQFATNAGGGMAYGHSNQLGTKEVPTGEESYEDPEYNEPLYDLNHKDPIPKDAKKRPPEMREVYDEDNRELWPAIIEKAYAMHAPLLGIQKQGQRAGGFDDIGEGGHSSTAFEALTGEPASLDELKDLGGAKLFEKISKALAAGSPVTAGTPGEGKTTEKLMSGPPIYGRHAYSVMALHGQEIELRNPWGNTYKGSDLDNRPELASRDNSGTIKLTLEEFRARFVTLHIGAARAPVK